MFCTRVPLVIRLSFPTNCYTPREPKFCGKPTHVTLESKNDFNIPPPPHPPFFFFSFAYSLSSILFIFDCFLLSFIVIRPQNFKTRILDLIIVIIFLSIIHRLIHSRYLRMQHHWDSQCQSTEATIWLISLRICFGIENLDDAASANKWLQTSKQDLDFAALFVKGKLINFNPLSHMYYFVFI